MLFGVFGGSLNSSTNLSSHLQMWDRSCLCGGYCLGNVLGELGACHLNHHIQIFAKQSLIFIGGYKWEQFKSISIPSFTLSGLVTFYLPLLKLPSHHLNNYKRKEWIVFKRTSQKACMNIHFPTSSQNCLKLSSCLIKILCRLKFRCLALCSPNHPIF
jgi:hypothetical protein